MSEIIYGQVRYLLASALSGMGCMFLYSIIRMFELLLKLCMPVKIIIDIIFWTGIAIPAFYIFYNINSGIIGWYGIVMIISGAVLYERGIYVPVKKSVEKIVRKVYNKNIFRRRKSL